MERPFGHKEVITEFDQERLGSYFADVLTTNDKYKLQSFCWYVIALHFELRGGKVFAQLKVSDLVLKKTKQGKISFSFTLTSARRTHQVVRSPKNFQLVVAFKTRCKLWL